MIRPAPALLAATLLAVTTVANPASAQAAVLPHETFVIQSSVLGEVRRINVWTPPGYADRRTRYPVLYMPDGGVDEDFPHLVATVDSAVRAGEMRPVIVVGIENTERRRDMTGPTRVHSDSAIAPRVGGSAAFRRFIARELMPEVRRRYRTTDETAIIGESLAGLFIMETFMEEPKLFDTYIALDPSLWWNREELVSTAAERLRSFRGVHAALYFSTTEEPSTSVPGARLADLLRANAPRTVRWTYVPRPDLQHSNIYRSVAPQVLRECLPPRTTRRRPAR